MAASKGKKAAKGSRPVRIIRAGRLSVSIFVNKPGFYSIVPQRFYLDDEDNAANTSSLGTGDLPTMASLLAAAFDFCLNNPLDDE